MTSWIALACAAPLLLCACGKPLSEDDCEALLNRYTELLIRADDPDAPAQHISELQQQARELAHNDPKYEFDRCSDEVSRKGFECAMRAPSVDEMERCLIF